jgi:hypothetical protein
VLISLLPLYLTAVIRRIWALIALSAICALAGLLSGVVAPTAQAEAWLAIDPLPWLIGSALIMVVLSVMNTIRSLRPNDDDIPDPRSTTHSDGTGTKIIVVITNWLFPLLALAMLGLAVSFR